jgi:hypothetical protein
MRGGDGMQTYQLWKLVVAPVQRKNRPCQCNSGPPHSGFWGIPAGTIYTLELWRQAVKLPLVIASVRASPSGINRLGTFAVTASAGPAHNWICALW